MPDLNKITEQYIGWLESQLRTVRAERDRLENELEHAHMDYDGVVYDLQVKSKARERLT